MSNLEFSFPFAEPVQVRRLPKKGHTIKRHASEDECAGIARLYDLEAVENFDWTCKLTPWKGDGVHVTGTVSAEISIPCARSGDPLPQKVKEEVDIIFVPEGSKLAKPPIDDDGEWVFDVDGAEIPEVFRGDSIDLAAVCFEFFSLGFDPFARIDDGDDATEDAAPSAEMPQNSPFSVLADLKFDK